MFYSPLMNELKKIFLKRQGGWQVESLSASIASNFCHLVILFATLQNDQSTSFVGLWQEDQTSSTYETTRQRMRDYLFIPTLSRRRWEKRPALFPYILDTGIM
jgi:hypothetical protein